MKSFYDDNAKKWDGYKAFHCHNANLFVEFDTGEFILHSMYPLRSPHRRTAMQVGVSFAKPFDPAPWLKQLHTPDGTPVRKAWVQGNPILMYDHTSKRVVLPSGIAPKKGVQLGVPQRFHGYATAFAYWPGKDQPPVTGDPITVYKPKKLTAEERKEWTTKLVKCRVFARVVPDQSGRYIPPYEIPSDEYFMNTSFEDLSPQWRYAVAKHGVSRPRETVEYDYLVVQE